MQTLIIIDILTDIKHTAIELRSSNTSRHWAVFVCVLLGWVSWFHPRMLNLEIIKHVPAGSKV